MKEEEEEEAAAATRWKGKNVLTAPAEQTNCSYTAFDSNELDKKATTTTANTEK